MAKMYYENIYFAQGEESEKALKILTEFGELSAMAYLIDFDYGESPIESINGYPWGDNDNTFQKDNYILSYNIGLEYISLVKIH